MNVFKAVKERVTTRSAAELYGLKVNRSGMTCCPFHNDRHPSMKVDRRFHCFGCQADGDVIDFTARLFHLSKTGAAMKLAEDFKIPNIDETLQNKRAPASPIVRTPRPSQELGKTVMRGSSEDIIGEESLPVNADRESNEVKSWRLERRVRKTELKVYDVYCRYLNLLKKWEQRYAPKDAEEEWDERFMEAKRRKEYVEELLDEFEAGTEEERIELIRTHKEEIVEIEQRLSGNPI